MFDIDKSTSVYWRTSFRDGDIETWRCTADSTQDQHVEKSNRKQSGHTLLSRRSKGTENKQSPLESNRHRSRVPSHPFCNLLKEKFSLCQMNRRKDFNNNDS